MFVPVTVSDTGKEGRKSYKLEMKSSLQVEQHAVKREEGRRRHLLFEWEKMLQRRDRKETGKDATSSSHTL